METRMLSHTESHSQLFRLPANKPSCSNKTNLVRICKQQLSLLLSFSQNA